MRNIETEVWIAETNNNIRGGEQALYDEVYQTKEIYLDEASKGYR